MWKLLFISTEDNGSKITVLDRASFLLQNHCDTLLASDEQEIQYHTLKIVAGGEDSLFRTIDDNIIYIYIYILKNKVIQKGRIYHEGKLTLKRFGFNEPSSLFDYFVFQFFSIQSDSIIDFHIDIPLNKPNKHIYIYIYLFVLFGLVSLFNGISTFVGYFMPKPFS